jgi:hypothetical protein
MTTIRTLVGNGSDEPNVAADTTPGGDVSEINVTNGFSNIRDGPIVLLHTIRTA